MTQKTVLITGEDRAMVHALHMRIRGLGLGVRIAHDLPTALALVQQSRPDLMLLDEDMPAGEEPGICATLAANPCAARIPVIVMTANKDGGTSSRRHDVPAYYIPKSPEVWRSIEPLIYELVDIEPPRQRANQSHEAL